MRQVRCTTPDCEHRGVVRDVPDMPVVSGVVQRPDLYCAGCGMAMPNIALAHKPTEKAVRRPTETRNRKAS